MDASDRKLFAGPRVRRLRQSLGLTQSRMAADLGLSVSYLNLLEHNQRPLTTPVLLKLVDIYDIDLRQFTSADADRRADDVAGVLTRLGLPLSHAEIRDFSDQHPEIASALLRLADSAHTQDRPPVIQRTPLELVQDHLLDRGHYLADLDCHAEALAEDLYVSGQSLEAGLRARLYSRHGLKLRLVAWHKMPDIWCRLDLPNRQIWLSELLDGPARVFQLGIKLAHLEAQHLIAAERDQALAHLAASQPDLSPDAETGTGATLAQILSHHLADYWAAALMMPYGRFQAAAESLGYDLDQLQGRFGASFEQVAHRLTTLQRPGARGIPFVLVHLDRAGQISKRLAAGRLPFASDGGQCPRWVPFTAFEQPGRIHTQIAEIETGERIFTLARTTSPQALPWGAEQPKGVIALTCALEHARGLVYAGHTDPQVGPAVPIGPACKSCLRANCQQRAVPPVGQPLYMDQAVRGPTPYRFSSKSLSTDPQAGDKAQ